MGLIYFAQPLSGFALLGGFSPVIATLAREHPMPFDHPPELTRLPGLYRLWDLQFALSAGADYEVTYAESTGDGTPLFAVYKRSMTLRPPAREALT